MMFGADAPDGPLMFCASEKGIFWWDETLTAWRKLTKGTSVTPANEAASVERLTVEGDAVTGIAHEPLAEPSFAQGFSRSRSHGDDREPLIVTAESASGVPSILNRS